MSSSTPIVIDVSSLPSINPSRPVEQRKGIKLEDAVKTFGISGCNADNSGLRDNCQLMALRSYCGHTDKERQYEADLRLNNRQYLFGITALGYQKPFLEATNPCHRDRTSGKPEMSYFLPNNDDETNFEKLAENFRSIDVYAGLVDGMNYGRYERRRHHHIRHTRNPLGPEVRFCLPITNNMNYGWWGRDMDLFKRNNQWNVTRERFPIVRGDVTKFLDDMYHHDPNFLYF